MDNFEEDEARSCSLLSSRWAELRASTTESQCLCVPAGPPGAEGCNQAGRQTKIIFSLMKNINEITSFL